MTDSQLKWLNSTGGPFILFEVEKAERWKGTESSDYWDVCAVPPDLVGVLHKPWGPVYIVGDEPSWTTVTRVHGKPVVLQWEAADSEAQLLELVKTATGSNCELSKSIPFALGGKRLRLTDSSRAGVDREESIDFLCPECTHVSSRYLRAPGVGVVVLEFQ